MSAVRYAALPDAALKRVRIGGLEAVYHRSSGITHLLAEPVPDLLDALGRVRADEPVSPAGLLRLIAGRFDIEGDDPSETHECVVAERLAELGALGLVQMFHDA